VVRNGDERAELDAELVLGRRDLVVMLLDLHAHLGQHGQHFGADVLAAVDRRDGEVATLRPRPVTQVTHLIFGAGVRRQFRRVELEAGVERIGREAHVIEDEELRLRTEVSGVADASLLQIGFGLLCDAARIALIKLAGGRLDDVAEDGERRLREERVKVRGSRIRDEQHVGGFDALPARDRGAVEGIPIREDTLIDAARIRGHVLHLTLGISEPQVYELYVLLLDQSEDVGWTGH